MSAQNLSRRPARLTALTAAVAVAAGGCSSTVAGTPVAAPDLAPPTTSTAPPTPKVPEGLAETEEVQLQPGKPGGTFRVADYQPASIDPAEVVTGSDVLIATALFTGLTVVGPDAEVKPGVATSWEADARCRTWTFALRKGTKFHNGEPVTAKSFVSGWVRAAKGGKGVVSQMQGITGYPKLGSAGLKAPDDATLVVKLRKPDCQFAVRAAHPVFSPLPKAGFSDSEPIGNGPFKLEGPWKADVGGTLARFDDYGAGDKAYLDTVEFRVMPDSVAAMAAFAAGEVDWARVPDEQQRSARDQFGPDGNWLARNTYGYTGLVPMLREKPLRSADARKAISMAIDREKIAESVLGGAVDPATGLLSSTFGAVHKPGNCSACEFDAAKAKALAGKSGLKRGAKLTLSIPDGSPSKKWAEAVAQQLEQNLGLKVELRWLPGGAYFEELGKPGATGLYRGAWLPDVALPDDMLRPLLASTSIKSGNNAGRYSNKKFDKLLDRAAGTGDETKRIKLYLQAELQAIGTDMAIIPLFERREFRAVNNAKYLNLRLDFYENPDLRVISQR